MGPLTSAAELRSRLRWRRRLRRAGLLCATVVLLVFVVDVVRGARIPDTGPVIAGARVAPAVRDGVLRVSPARPREGDSPLGIVEGFLAAGRTAVDDHAAARSYLTAQVSTRWRSDPVLVFSGSQRIRVLVTAPDTVAVEAGAVARIDRAGRWVAAPPGDRHRATFRLARVSGEWRIAALPDGVLVSQPDLEREFRAFPLYFVDPQSAVLAPDVRWFPYGRSSATVVVRSLLAGPSPWLSGAVTNAFPPGTELATGAVPVAQGTAVVDLTRAVLRSSRAQRRVMLAQLEASLIPLADVSAVRMTAEGSNLEIVPFGRFGGTDEQGPVVDPGVDERPVLMARGKVARVDAGVAQAVRGLGGLDGAGSQAPAVAPAGSPYAVLGSSRRVLVCQAEGGPAQILARTRDPMTSPSFDRLGWVWVAVRHAGGPVLAARMPRPAETLRTPWLAGTTQVTGLRVSRDGTRVVLTLQQGRAVRVVVSGVLRDERGRPVELLEPSPSLAPMLTEVRDVAWVGDDEVVVLAGGPAVPVQPVLVQVGGPVALTAPIPDARTVAAANRPRDLLVGTGSGRLWQRNGSGWTPVAVADAYDVAFPG